MCCNSLVVVKDATDTHHASVSQEYNKADVFFYSRA